MKNILSIYLVLLGLFLSNNNATACKAAFTYELEYHTTLKSYTDGTPVAFFGKAEGVNNKWLWDFGDGTKDSVQNPIHVFKSQGVYKVTLTTFPDWCVAVFTDTVVIQFPNPVDNYYKIPLNGTFTIQLPSNPTTGYSWVWANQNASSIIDTIGYSFIPDTPVMLGSGGIENFTFLGKRVGIDTIIMEYKRYWEAGVQDKKLFLVEVTDTSGTVTCNADFSYHVVPTLVDCECAGVYAFDDESTGKVVKRLWTFSDGATSTDSFLVHTFSTAGIYSVTLEISTSNGCDASITKMLYLGDTCILTGIFHKNFYDKCEYPVITSDSENFVIVRGNTSGIPDGAKVKFGIYEDMSMSAYYKCGKYTDRYVILTCARVLDSIAPNPGSCTTLGTYYDNYSDCNLPTIVTDNQVFRVINGFDASIPSGSVVKFGYYENKILPANILICGSTDEKYITITCLDYCFMTGSYWKHYPDSLGNSLDCEFPIIKSDDGTTILVLDTLERELPDGARVKFGGIFDYTKILRPSCIPYDQAIRLNCLQTIDSIPPMACFLLGTVYDYTGLDGCGYVIKLDNGITLEPVVIDQPFMLYDRQRVKLSYKELPDFYSVCMVGIIAEITCIEEVFNQPPDACSFFVTLTTSITIGDPGCNGYANAYAFSPINSWLLDRCGKRKKCIVDPVVYTYLWSTGDTGSTISNLCPNQLYSIKVTDTQHNCSVTSAFALFQASGINTSWTYQKVDSLYYFNIPSAAGYRITWAFDDGTVISGSSISKAIEGNGEHKVVLKIYNNLGEVVYTELIPISVETSIKETTINNNLIFVYPVPAGKEINLRFKAAYNSTTVIDIMDLFGRVVSSTPSKVMTGDNLKTINVTSLPNGVYIGIVRLDGNYMRFKFTK